MVNQQRHDTADQIDDTTTQRTHTMTDHLIRIVSLSLSSLSILSVCVCLSASASLVAPSSALLRSSTALMSTKPVERPISPHVTIYDFPVPALSSITNRATGVAMGVGVMGMSFVALAGGCDIPAYVESVKTSAPVLMPLVKLAVGFPIVYHTAAGVRHMVRTKTTHKTMDQRHESMRRGGRVSGIISADRDPLFVVLFFSSIFLFSPVLGQDC